MGEIPAHTGLIAVMLPRRVARSKAIIIRGHQQHESSRSAPDSIDTLRVVRYPEKWVPMTNNTTEQVTCAFCQGQKTDPFGVLSDRSRCEVCCGTGTVQVAVPHDVCAFCAGSGAYKAFSCPVCHGRGAVAALAGPTAVCDECRGTGSADATSGLPCLGCHGRGKILAQNTGH